jgi:hypothetical protein
LMNFYRRARISYPRPLRIMDNGELLNSLLNYAIH